MSLFYAAPCGWKRALSICNPLTPGCGAFDDVSGAVTDQRGPLGVSDIGLRSMSASVRDTIV